MKGLFKQKPLTPVELVHHIRELLTYTCPNPDVREAKRQDKVNISTYFWKRSSAEEMGQTY